MDTAMTSGVFAKNNTVAPKYKRVLPLFSLKGKTAIVTGAAAGIGFEVAQTYAEAGADVVILDIDAKGHDRAAEIEAEYGVNCKWAIQ